MYQVSNQLKNLLVEHYTAEYAGMTAEELLESNYFLMLSGSMVKMANEKKPTYSASIALQKAINDEPTSNYALEWVRKDMYGVLGRPLGYHDCLIARLILADMVLSDTKSISNGFDIKKEVEALKASFIESFNVARQSA